MSKFVLYSGHMVDINDDESIKTIPIEDIAHHLAKIQRFNGATPCDVSYTVAEHCINLVNYLQILDKRSLPPTAVLALLLHDASEALLGDIVSDIKASLPDYKHIEKRVQMIIYNQHLKYNINYLNRYSTYFKSLDKQILIDEVRHVMPEKLELYKKETGLTGLGCDILFNNHPSTAKQCFLTMFKNLQGCV